MNTTQTTLGALAPGDVLVDSLGTPLMLVTTVERGTTFKDYVLISGNHPSGVGTAKSIGGPITKVCYVAQLPTRPATTRHWLHTLLILGGVILSALLLLFKSPTHKRERSNR